jgi:hypothetical protein
MVKSAPVILTSIAVNDVTGVTEVFMCSPSWRHIVFAWTPYSNATNLVTIDNIPKFVFPEDKVCAPVQQSP